MTTWPKQIKLKSAAKGWCSWYAFGEHISEKIILNQARWLHEHQFKDFKYVLIDDGWEQQWGDWRLVDKTKFPSGLKKTAQRIKQLGLSPGVWIAPFLVSPDAKLVQEHPDWLVRQNGRLVDGFRFTNFDLYFSLHKYILDVKNPRVVKYLENIIDWLVVKCGFELLKLDFLYGIYFSPQLTMDEADSFLQSFLARIKRLYPHVYTIACGCPVLPAVGVVDSMRIGPDTLLPGLQSIPLLKNVANTFMINQVLVAIKQKKWTKSLWNVDGDVFVCGEQFGSSDTTIKALHRGLRSTAGNIFLGDDLTKLSSTNVKKYIKSMSGSA